MGDDVKSIITKIAMASLLMILTAFDSQVAYEPEAKEATVFVTIMRIHEDMPEFTFYRKIGEPTLTSYPPSPRDFDHVKNHIVITIVDENGDIVQEIDDITQGGHGDWMTADWDAFDIQFDDFNFDGYMDMWLIYAVNPGTAGGMWAHFWLWDIDAGQFVQDEQLSAISNMAWLRVNQKTQQVEVSSRGGGAGPWITSYYKYRNGEFVLAANALTEWIFRDFVPSYKCIHQCKFFLPTHPPFRSTEYPKSASYPIAL
ncbi:MAG: hypothetical protein FWE34_05535 [Defluviitaleaceae bacterium]|nr:hypothetical protein [Defluviitaleaceae bacterium]